MNKRKWQIFVILIIFSGIIFNMVKIKDLSSRFDIPDAEKELELLMGQIPMGSQQGGLSLYSNKFKRGYGNAVFGSDENGIWLGAAEFAAAPFRVNMQGDVVASSADFGGTGYTKINIFSQDDIPTSISIGDLWFDTNGGNKLYRAGSAGANEITVGEWEAVDDTRKITIFAQDSIPTSLAIGDLWYDTNDDNKPYIADSIGANQITAGEWEIVEDARAADALLRAGSTQTLSGDILVGASSVKIDGANTRIVIHDGVTNRGVFGDV